MLKQRQELRQLLLLKQAGINRHQRVNPGELAINSAKIDVNLGGN
jgi:hypothetical protein